MNPSAPSSGYTSSNSNPSAPASQYTSSNSNPIPPASQYASFVSNPSDSSSAFKPSNSPSLQSSFTPSNPKGPSPVSTLNPSIPSSYTSSNSRPGQSDVYTNNSPPVTLKPVPEIVKPTIRTTKKLNNYVGNAQVSKVKAFASPNRPPSSWKQAVNSQQTIYTSQGAGQTNSQPSNIGDILQSENRDNKYIYTNRPMTYQTASGNFVPPSTLLFGFKPMTEPTNVAETSYKGSQRNNIQESSSQYKGKGKSRGNKIKSYRSNPRKVQYKKSSSKSGGSKKSSGDLSPSGSSMIDQISQFLEPFTKPFTKLFSN